VRIIITKVLLVLVLLSLFTMIPLSIESPDKHLVIGVSTESLASIVRDIVNGKCEVFIILPEGAEPHTYQLKPEDIEKTKNADLLVFTGHFIFEEKIIETLKGVKPILTLNLATNTYGGYKVEIFTMPWGSSYEKNYHAYWLYPKNAITIAKALVDSLVRVDPENKEFYKYRLMEFQKRVSGILALVKKQKELLKISDINVVLAFPAEQYIVSALGFRIIGMLSKGEGIFVGGGKLLEIKDKLKSGAVLVASDIVKMLKVGEFIDSILKETNAQVIYIKVRGVSELTYTELLAYNLGSLLNALASLKSTSASGSSSTAHNREINATIIYGLIVILCLIITIEAYIIYTYSKKIEKLRRKIREIESKWRRRE